MFSVLRNRLGIPGLISVIALVLAMGGGAYAADSGGDGATASAKNRGGNVGNLIKREARKFSKRFSQRFSRRFAGTGPQGPRGINGSNGARGDKGDRGDDGDKGDTGKEGKEGPEGSPWTELGTLPEGESLKGTWGLNGASGQFLLAPISFG